MRLDHESPAALQRLPTTRCHDIEIGRCHLVWENQLVCGALSAAGHDGFWPIQMVLIVLQIHALQANASHCSLQGLRGRIAAAAGHGEELLRLLFGPRLALLHHLAHEVEVLVNRVDRLRGATAVCELHPTSTRRSRRPIRGHRLVLLIAPRWLVAAPGHSHTVVLC